MVYTEIKERNGRRYFYRVISVRKAKTISKERIYLGKDLPRKALLTKEQNADRILTTQKKKMKLKAINRLIPKIRKILIKNKVKKAGIFGSYARGEQKKNSDIDILIKPTKHMGFEFFGLQLELEDKLGKKVDLVSYKGISPYLRKYILDDEVRIL